MEYFEYSPTLAQRCTDELRCEEGGDPERQLIVALWHEDEAQDWSPLHPSVMAEAHGRRLWRNFSSNV